jgi:hypothetical protein
VTTPYLLSASQFDKYQLPYNEGGMPPYVGSNASYASAFQDAVRDVVLSLPTAAQPRSAVYSSACFKHCTSTLAWGAFWGVRVDDVSLRSYLSDWYFGGVAPNNLTAGAAALPAGMSHQRIEACNSFGCGQCHKKVAAPAPPLPPAYAMSLIPGGTPGAGKRGAGSAARSSTSTVVVALLVLLLAAVAVAGTQRMRASTRLRSVADASMEMPFVSEASPLLRPPGAAKR